MKSIFSKIFIKKYHPINDAYRIYILKILILFFTPFLCIESITLYNLGLYPLAFVEFLSFFLFLFFLRKMWDNIHIFANFFIILSFLLCIITFLYYIEHISILIFFVVFPTFYIYFLGLKKGITVLIIICLMFFLSIIHYYHNYQQLPWPKETFIIAIFSFLYVCFLTSAYERTNSSLLANLKEKAELDGLTNIFNRRTFFEFFQHEVERCKRYSSHLSLLILDIDYFKQINDNYGHQVGDKVLCSVVKLCSQSLRKSDLIGRIGGEEFACLLPDTDVEAAHHVAEKIRRIIDESNEKLLPHCTVSIGISEYISNDTTSQLYQRADKGLYLAKSFGRNRIAIGQEP